MKSFLSYRHGHPDLAFECGTGIILYTAFSRIMDNDQTLFHKNEPTEVEAHPGDILGGGNLMAR
jgi:hypothetical protein